MKVALRDSLFRFFERGGPIRERALRLLGIMIELCGLVLRVFRRRVATCRRCFRGVVIGLRLLEGEPWKRAYLEQVFVALIELIDAIQFVMGADLIGVGPRN